MGKEKEHLTTQQVEKLVCDIFHANDDPEELNTIKKVVAKHCKEGKLDINDIFGVVRNYDDKRDEASWWREQDAAKAAGFSPLQVASFRNKFVQSDTDGSGFLSEKEIQKIFDDVLRLNSNQIAQLQHELS